MCELMVNIQEYILAGIALRSLSRNLAHRDQPPVPRVIRVVRLPSDNLLLKPWPN